MIDSSEMQVLSSRRSDKFYISDFFNILVKIPFDHSVESRGIEKLAFMQAPPAHNSLSSKPNPYGDA
jgi:hypothetical protein